MPTLNRPSVLAVIPEAIPAELRDLSAWVVWRIEERDGKWTKPPYSAATGRPASSTDPETWTTYTKALRAYQRPAHPWEGIGIALSPESDLAGIDLDHCIDPQTGEIREWALVIVRRLNSYTERSPSGAGLRIFVKAKLPPGGRKKDGVEVYDRGRYLTVTGHHLDGTPTTIEERTEEVGAWHAETFPAEEKRAGTTERPAPVPLDLTDEELLKVAFGSANGAGIQDLFAGRWEGRYDSRSEADGALTAHLMFYAQGDAARVDRMFRSSGLMRPKWDEPHYADGTTYGEGTVGKAYALVTQYWKPPGSIRTFEAAHRNGAEEPDEDAPRPLAGKLYQTTDVGNAERLVRSHGKDLRYCHPWKKWLTWDGVRWAPDATGEADRRAVDTAKAIWKEVAEEDDADQRKRLVKHALESESNKSVRAMLARATSLPGVPVLPVELDRHPWLLCVGNGVLNLRTGRLVTPRRDNLMTRRTEVPFIPEATCPLWLGFLDYFFDENAELIGFMRRAAGYCLTGSTAERCFFIAYGAEGDNGKSTFLKALAAVLGEYGERAEAETLMKRREGAPTNDIAALRGARYAFASETEEGRQLAVSLIKDLTGGDPIKARFLYAEGFTFQPEVKLWLATNHRPRITDANRAIWNRIRLVPFSVTIPKSEQDLYFDEKLKAELPGILRWMVDGCLEYQRVGLAEPSEVRAATEEYRAHENLVGVFLAEETVTTRGTHTQADRMYQRFVGWAATGGERPMSRRKFGEQLRDLGLRPFIGTDNYTFWENVGLVSHGDE